MNVVVQLCVLRSYYSWIMNKNKTLLRFLRYSRTFWTPCWFLLFSKSRILLNFFYFCNICHGCFQLARKILVIFAIFAIIADISGSFLVSPFSKSRILLNVCYICDFCGHFGVFLGFFFFKSWFLLDLLFLRFLRYLLVIFWHNFISFATIAKNTC